MKSRFLRALAAVAVAGCALAAPPPRIGLPPEELKPERLFQTVAADEGPDWGVVILNVPEVWKTTKGKGVKVCVGDTGASLTHPDLKEAYKGSRDFTGSKTGVTDVQGHGTHCAGSVGARGPLPGVAPECDIYSAKVLDDSGSGGVDEIAAGIRYAAKVWEVDVISLSLGGPTPDDWVPPAIREAVEAGVIVVCAAGNEGPRENTEGYPGGYKDSISVAAADKTRAIANFSSRGKNVFIAAPGVNIRSTYPGGQYATMSGTSMACPHLAGVAALWVAAHPEIKKKDRPAAFREALKGSTKFTDRTTSRGYGLPDAAKVIGTAGAVPPPAPPGERKVYTLDLLKLKAEGYTGVVLDFGTGAKEIDGRELPADPERAGGISPHPWPAAVPAPVAAPAVVAPPVVVPLQMPTPWQFQQFPPPQFVPQFQPQQGCPPGYQRVGGQCQPAPGLRAFRPFR